MPSNEPMFSGADLGRLFSVADGTQSSTIKRWLDAGQITVEISEGRSKSGQKLRITPAAVLAFVKAHPDAYDWRKISDPVLKGVAEAVEKRDPLMAIDEAIAGTPIKKADVVRLAVKGYAGVVTRWSGAQGTLARELFIRRSALTKLHATIEAERRLSDPFHVLHVLIEADTVRAAPSQIEHGQVDGHATIVVRAPGQVALTNGLPPRLKFEERRCPRCGATRTTVPSDDGFELSCMSCGQSDPLVDPAAEARREARRLAEGEAIAAESRPRRGRPPKALAGAAG